MSKLRDRIRDISRRRPAPFGFAAMRGPDTASARQVLVAAEVDDADKAARAAADGADLLIFTGALSHLGEVVAAAGKALVGARVDAATPQDVATVREAGAAFLVCADDQADAAALRDQQVGYVMLAPSSVTPGLTSDDLDARLRSFRGLDLDAVLVGSLPETMTVRQQLQARRLGELTRKPLIAHVAGPVSTATLELWRDTGVVTVLGPLEVTAALAAAADAVPAPRKPQAERAEPILPAVPAASSLEDEEDEF